MDSGAPYIWLGQESSAALMHGLDLADKLRIELLNGQIENAKKPLPQELLVHLLEIVKSFKDSIKHLRHGILPQQTPSKQQPHAHQSVKDGPLCTKTLKRRHSKVIQVSQVPEGYEDPYIWRKYGRKPIHGQKHPRNYYKCVHKEDLSCPAMKRTQRCEDNDNLFEVTYIGKHICEEISDSHTHYRPLSPPNESMNTTENFTSHRLGPSPKACDDSQRDRVDVAKVVQLSSFPFDMEDGLCSILEQEISYTSTVNTPDTFQAVEQQSEMYGLFPSSSHWDLDLGMNFPAIWT